MSSSSSSSSSSSAAAAAEPEPDSPPALEEYENENENNDKNDAKANDKKKTASSYYFFKSTPKEEAAKFAPIPIPTPSPSPPSSSSSSSSSAAPASTSAPAGGLSAWNSAGTWEERDMSSWSSSHVKQCLLEVQHEVAGAGTAKISAVTKAEGDSSIVFTRGKKRPGYDLHISCEWSATLLSGSSSGGNIEIPEFETSVDIDEVRIKFSHKTGDAAGLKIIKAAEKKIRQQLTQFVKDLQAQC